MRIFSSAENLCRVAFLIYVITSFAFAIPFSSFPEHEAQLRHANQCGERKMGPQVCARKQRTLKMFINFYVFKKPLIGKHL